MKRRQLLSPAVLGFALLLGGCQGQVSRNPPVTIWPDMKFQPKYKPQLESKFFADRRVTRLPVPGTVAVGHMADTEEVQTGVVNGMYTGKNPIQIDRALLVHGQRRFNTFCSPCHDRTGTGQGTVALRAQWIPTNLQDDRVRQMTDGEIFNVITHGRRSMPSYRHQIETRDRWAIVAYVRALHRASAATVEDVPADLRPELR